MITLFTTCKLFRGHQAIIQRNAITSWTLLNPRPHIIVFGNEEGTEKIADDLKLQYVPDVKRNQYGTPLVSDLFEKGQDLSKFHIFCYINADIILMNKFMYAVNTIVNRRRRFLMIGHRYDVDIREAIYFKKDWENRIRKIVNSKGELHSHTGIDYFVFTRNLWTRIPQFAIGRTKWDNWLIYSARSKGVSVIDATNDVLAIHQNHDYSHAKGSITEGRKGVDHSHEAKYNLLLARDGIEVLTLRDATHYLIDGRLKLALTKTHINRHLEILPKFYPALRLPFFLLKKAVTITHPIRRILKFKKQKVCN